MNTFSIVLLFLTISLYGVSAQNTAQGKCVDKTSEGFLPKDFNLTEVIIIMINLSENVCFLMRKF